MTLPTIFDEPYTRGVLSGVIDAILNVSDVFNVVDAKAAQAQDVVNRIQHKLQTVDYDTDEYNELRGRVDAFQLLHDRANRIVAKNPDRYAAKDPRETT